MTLEIGLAYGYSTLFFLAAHGVTGGRHVAIDPKEVSGWHGIGLQKIREIGMEQSFRWIEEPSALALPTLIREGQRFDVIFIDGDHRFDGALLDFKLCDLACAEEGHVIFDDLWLPSVRKVISFLDRNRPDYVKQNTAVANIAVYRKVGADRRGWRHFVEF